MSTCVDKQAVDAKLSLLVDFKLRVHFAVRQLTSAAAKGATGGCSAIDRFTHFSNDFIRRQYSCTIMRCVAVLIMCQSSYFTCILSSSLD